MRTIIYALLVSILLFSNPANSSDNSDNNLTNGWGYLTGKDNHKIDRKRGVQLLENEALKNNALAQYLLGTAYFSGSTGIPNFIFGYKWLKLSSLNGDADAQEILDISIPDMRPEQIKEAERLIVGIGKQQNYGELKDLVLGLYKDDTMSIGLLSSDAATDYLDCVSFYAYNNMNKDQIRAIKRVNSSTNNQDKLINASKLSPSIKHAQKVCDNIYWKLSGR